MRYGISISPAGPGGDPASMAELAAQAEQAGWDGIFLEDYIVYQGQAGPPTYDPWVTMAAMAVATRRVRLGTSVTPVPRRRPWKLASEAVTLDLSAVRSSSPASRSGPAVTGS
jgi:alkanesulfonate monooxygenase SsuD/methylene tetrahydromethanopterin reductase-like flavin-dependent oxidoreductase (luciferase family)